MKQQVTANLIEFLNNFCGIQVSAELPIGSLSELGIDSFNLLELLLHLEQSFHRRFPAEQLTIQNTASLPAFIDAYIKHAQDFS